MEAMSDRLLQIGKFELLPEGGNRCCTIISLGRSFQILKASKATLWNVFD